MNKKVPVVNINLEEFLTETNLTQIIKDHTRVTDKSESLLHVIMVWSSSITESSGVLDTCISDHLHVYANIKLKIHETSRVTTPEY